jgi:hypothetical protein
MLVPTKMSTAVTPHKLIKTEPESANRLEALPSPPRSPKQAKAVAEVVGFSADSTGILRGAATDKVEILEPPSPKSNKDVPDAAVAASKEDRHAHSEHAILQPALTFDTSISADHIADVSKADSIVGNRVATFAHNAEIGVLANSGVSVAIDKRDTTMTNTDEEKLWLDLHKLDELQIPGLPMKTEDDSDDASMVTAADAVEANGENIIEEDVIRASLALQDTIDVREELYASIKICEEIIRVDQLQMQEWPSEPSDNSGPPYEAPTQMQGFDTCYPLSTQLEHTCRQVETLEQLRDEDRTGDYELSNSATLDVGNESKEDNFDPSNQLIQEQDVAVDQSRDSTQQLESTPQVVGPSVNLCHESRPTECGYEVSPLGIHLNLSAHPHFSASFAAIWPPSLSRAE